MQQHGGKKTKPSETDCDMRPPTKMSKMEIEQYYTPRTAQDSINSFAPGAEHQDAFSLVLNLYASSEGRPLGSMSVKNLERRGVKVREFCVLLPTAEAIRRQERQ